MFFCNGVYRETTLRRLDAINAVQRWVFKPGRKDGAPVATFATIQITFRLL
jgi:hypothetical protein